MYKDHMKLVGELNNYASPKARLTRMIRNGEVIQVRRNIFLNGDDNNYSLKSLGNVIYGPSYISFEFALSYYGLIPERAAVVTCAVYNKNKNRVFKTPVGDFYYYYLPKAAYPYEVLREMENDQPYLIASVEKAFCDTLYKTKGIRTRRELLSLLFEDWRMEKEKLLNFNYQILEFLAPIYQRKIHRLFMEWYKLEKTNE